MTAGTLCYTREGVLSHNCSVCVKMYTAGTVNEN